MMHLEATIQSCVLLLILLLSPLSKLVDVVTAQPPPNITTNNYFIYQLQTEPFINPNSTLPFHVNESSLIWTPVWNSSQLSSEWCNPAAWLEYGCAGFSTQWIPHWGWSAPILFNFNVSGSLISNVSVSPSGLISFGPPSPAIDEDGYYPIFGYELAQPDPRFDDRQLEVEALFWFGWSANILWDVQWMNYTIIQDSTTLSSILLIRGACLSFFNSTHPNSNTSLEFELQLHQSTGNIVMHLQLLNATVADLINPISIGISSFYPVTASMFLNNQFPSDRNVSATLIWSPRQIMDPTCANSGWDCSSCTSVGCSWCQSTSTCLEADVPSSSNDLPNSTSTLCPELIVLDVCPPALIYSCEACITTGYSWCTGEANCYLSLTNVESCDAGNAYEYLYPGENYPSCIPADSTCGQQTCNQFYDAQGMDCLVNQPNAMNQVVCACQPGYKTESGPDGPQYCSQCDVDNGYYETDDNTCELCPSLSATTIVIFFLVAVVIAILLIKLNSHPLIRKLLVPIQNSIVYFQVISLLGLIDFHWPLAIRKTFSFYSLLGLNLLHAPTICFVTYDESITIVILAPVVIGGILIMFSLVQWTYQRIRVCLKQMALSDATLLSRKRGVLFIRAYISFLLLFYNYLVWTCLNAYWHIAYNIVFIPADHWPNDTRTTQETNKFILVFSGTIIYVIGIPVLFWLLIFPRQQPALCCCGCKCCSCCCMKPVLKSDILIPLTSKYRAGLCQYWECTFVPLWKLLFNAIIVFVSDRNQQIGLLSALLLLMVASYTYVKPYTSLLNNKEQQWLMSGSLLILLSGLLFYVSSPNTSQGTYITLCVSYVIAIGTMALMAGVIIYVIYLVVRQYRQDQAANQLNPSAADDPNKEVDAEEEDAVGAVDGRADRTDYQPISDPAAPFEPTDSVLPSMTMSPI